MRKISYDACAAFVNRRKFKRGNTEVKVFANSVELLLHGNIIAELVNDGGLWITSAGWKSNTTKERLNSLPHVYIKQKDFQWYLNGDAWSGDWTLVCKILI